MCSPSLLYSLSRRTRGGGKINNRHWLSACDKCHETEYGISLGLDGFRVEGYSHSQAINDLKPLSIPDHYTDYTLMGMGT